MKQLTLVMLLIVSTMITASGQDDAVFNRLHGESIDETLMIFFEANKFTYKTDSDANAPVLEDGKLFVLKSKKNRVSVFVKYGFINPLRYNFSSSATQIDDPVFTTVANFFNPSSATATAVTAQVAKVVTGTSTESGRATPVTTPVRMPQSLLLAQWIYSFKKEVDLTTTTNIDSLKKLVGKLNMILKAENLFYGKMLIAGDPTETTEKDFSSWISGIGKKMYDAESFGDFKTQLSIQNTVKDNLNTEVANAKKAITDIRALLGSKFDETFTNFILPARLEDFKNLSAAYAAMLQITTDPQFKQAEAALAKLNSQMKTLNDHFKKFDKNGIEKKATEYTFKINDTKMTDIKLSVTPKNESGTEDTSKALSVEVKIARFEPVVFFASAGAIFTDLTYNNYGVTGAAGSTTITQLGDTHVRTRPVAFLNGLINVKSQIVYPFLQVGIASGEGSPLYAVGAGLMIRRFVTVSGGVTLGTAKGLPGTLYVGGPVADEITLKNQLEDHGITAGYFSINVKLISLTK